MSTTLFAVRNLSSSIADAPKLHDISLAVGRGELVVVLGANGAGKSSLLGVLANQYPASRGEVLLENQSLLGLPVHKVVAAGLVMAPQNHPIFESLTVSDNLSLGRRRPDAKLFELFPNLEAKRTQLAGRLSGGERQMLSMAQALMTEPKLLLLDEPSSGLAPKVTQQVFRAVKSLVAQGMSVLMVEQNAKAALTIADRAYVMEHGRVVLEGRASDIAANDHVRQAYLGL